MAYTCMPMGDCSWIERILRTGFFHFCVLVYMNHGVSIFIIGAPNEAGILLFPSLCPMIYKYCY